MTVSKLESALLSTVEVLMEAMGEQHEFAVRATKIDRTGLPADVCVLLDDLIESGGGE